MHPSKFTSSPTSPTYRWAALLLLISGLTACASARPTSDATTSESTPALAAGTKNTENTEHKLSVNEKGLDARLSNFKYPYPVEIFAFEAQRQPLEIAYMDIAPEKPNGRTVVLLHGKNFSGAYWERTIQALVAEGYRVVVPDQIGFGKSSKPEHFQFSFQELATHTHALLDKLAIERAEIVSHSMGGMLGARFALMFPERTASLTLINPIGLEDWKRVVPYTSIDAWYEAELKGDPESVREYMRFAYFDGQWKDIYDELIEIQGGWKIGPDAERMAWIGALTYDMIFTQPVLYEFDQISVPTLLIIGVRDRTALGRGSVAPEIAATLGNYDKLGQRAAAAIPDSTLVELNNVGHVPQFEDFDRYYQALQSFLAAQEKPR